jgi:hypothetical protein
VIFGEGLQVLPPERLQALLYTVGLEGDDLELGARHLAFWNALFEAFAGDPENLVNAMNDAGGIMGDTEAAAEDNISLIETLVELPPEDRSLIPLPTTPLQVGDGGLYVVRKDEVTPFIADFIGSDDQQHEVTRVQILNGRNDAPGIGQEVAARLVQEGFNVILTGNAPRLDYKRTLLIVYDSSPEQQALAERARELLGVGRVQISTQDQGIVDLTIVVGKDFQRAP